MKNMMNRVLSYLLCLSMVLTLLPGTGLHIHAEEHICEDNNFDHNCDTCGEYIPCFDNEADEDTLCNLCSRCLHGEVDDDGYCLECGVCVLHTFDNNCWHETETAHYPECDRCEYYNETEPGAHEGMEDAICDICWYHADACDFLWEDGNIVDETEHLLFCICGDEQWEAHVDANEDHFCDVCSTCCGIPHGELRWEDGNKIDSVDHWLTCPVCNVYGDWESHDTEGENGACSVCGYQEYACEHSFDGEFYYSDETGHYPKCDFCDYYDEAAWEAHDLAKDSHHICWTCGWHDGSLCFDNDGDHSCDLAENCGKKMSWLCTTEDGDHRCDVCGDLIEGLCEDENSDHLCDGCLERLSDCEDCDDDGTCDICDTEMAQVEGYFTSLSYTYDEAEGAVLASGTLRVSANRDGKLVLWDWWQPMTVDLTANTPQIVPFSHVPLGYVGYCDYTFTPTDGEEVRGSINISDSHSMLSVDVGRWISDNESLSMDTQINEWWSDILYLSPDTDVRVHLNLQPGDSYEVVNCQDWDEQPVEYTDDGNGTITFTMPQSLTKVYLEIDCQHDETACTDENNDHLCDSDICKVRIPGGDENHDNRCDLCGMGLLRLGDIVDCDLDDLIERAADGDTITLLADHIIEGDASWSSAAGLDSSEKMTVTLNLNGCTLSVKQADHLLSTGHLGVIKIVDSSAEKTGQLSGGAEAILDLGGTAIDQSGGMFDLRDYPDPSGLTVVNSQRVPAGVSGHQGEEPIVLLLPEGYRVRFNLDGNILENTLIPAGTVATVVKVHDHAPDENGLCDCGKTLVASVTIDGITEYFTTFFEAKEAAAAGTEEQPAKLKMLADCDLAIMPDGSAQEDGGIIKTGVIHMDLNGHTLTNSANRAKLTVTRADKTLPRPVVTIDDTSAAGTGKIVAGRRANTAATYAVTVVKGAHVTLMGGTYVGEYAVNVEDAGTELVFDGAVVDKAMTDTPATIYTAIDIEDSTVTVKSGRICAQRPFDVKGGALIITGTPVVCEEDGSPMRDAIMLYQDGTVDLSGCTGCDRWKIYNRSMDHTAMVLGETLKLPEGYVLYDVDDITTVLEQLEYSRYGRISAHIHRETDGDGDHVCDHPSCGETITSHDYDEASYICAECGVKASFLVTYTDESTVLSDDLEYVLEEETGVVSVKLLRDVTLTDDCYVMSQVELNLNGYTLDTGDEELEIDSFEGCHLTITGSGRLVGLYTPLQNSGTLTILGDVSIECGLSNDGEQYAHIVIGQETAVVDLRDCTTCDGWNIYNEAWIDADDGWIDVPVSAENVILPEGRYLIDSSGIKVGDTIGALETVTIHHDCTDGADDDCLCDLCGKDLFTASAADGKILLENIPAGLKIIIAGYTGGQMTAVQLVETMSNSISVEASVLNCDTVRSFFLVSDAPLRDFLIVK